MSGKNRQISDERGDSCNPKSMEVVSPLYLPEYESHRYSLNYPYIVDSQPVIVLLVYSTHMYSTYVDRL